MRCAFWGGMRLFVWLTVVWASGAGACPDCPSARLVQQSVFDHRFWSNLFFVSSPLVVLCFVGAWLYRLGEVEQLLE
jgi:hypothetical protein